MLSDQFFLDESVLQQFRVQSIDAQGFQIVGKNNKAVDSDYLFEMWRRGEPWSEEHRKFMDNSRLKLQQLDLWALPLEERLALLNEWNEEHIVEPLHLALGDILSAIAAIDRELTSLQHENDVQFLRQARVIGCTTTGAAIHKDLLDAVRPRVLLLEEAAEILETQVIAALGSCAGSRPTDNAADGI